MNNLNINSENNIRKSLVNEDFELFSDSMKHQINISSDKDLIPIIIRLSLSNYFRIYDKDDPQINFKEASNEKEIRSIYDKLLLNFKYSGKLRDLCEEGPIEELRELLNKNNIGLDKIRPNLLEIALASEQFDAFDLLLKKGATFESNKYLLHWSISYSIDDFFYALEEGIEVTEFSDHYIRFLLERDYPLNFIDHNNQTPLDYAYIRKHRKGIKLLKECGAKTYNELKEISK